LQKRLRRFLGTVCAEQPPLWTQQPQIHGAIVRLAKEPAKETPPVLIPPLKIGAERDSEPSPVQREDSCRALVRQEVAQFHAAPGRGRNLSSVAMEEDLTSFVKRATVSAWFKVTDIFGPMEFEVLSPAGLM
jgi:hypothetical protein